MVSGVAQVQRLRRAEVRGARSTSIRTQLAARQIGIDEVAHGDRRRERQPADRHALRPAADLRRPDQRPADARAERIGRSIVAYRNGSPVRLERGRATSTTASRTTRTASWFNGDARDLPRDPAPAGHQHRRRSSTRSRRCCRSFRSSCRRRSTLDIRSDRSVSIRESVHDVKFTLLLTVCLVVLVIFLFLRNLSATIIPSLALPFSIVGTFAVMYAARLQPRQPVADGADALGRLRRRRRDRDAGEHRPAHGDGQAADAGGARRLEGDRLHDPLDDAVARRGVHPGAVHGRHRRPAAARVRGHDRGGDSGLGLRVAHADADAVQPLPASRRTRSATAGSTTRSSACSTRGCDAYDWTLQADASASRARRWWSRSLLLVGTVYLFTDRAEGLHPERRHRAASTARSRRCRASASTTMVRAPAARSWPIVCAGSERRRLHVERRRRRPAAATAAAQRRPQAARRAHADGRPDHRRSCGRSWRRCRASACSCRTRRRSASAACSRAQPVPVHAAGSPTPTSCIACAPALEAALRDVPGLAGRQQRPADQEPAGAASTIDRDQIAALGPDRRTRSRPRSTTPTARGRSRRSTRRTTSTR